MQIRIFTISSFNDSEAQDELNRFLRGHRILEVKQEYDSQRGYWSFSVSYMEGSMPSTGSSEHIRQEKVDYKEVLSPEIFEVFSRLREKRKKIAQEEHVPAYAIFTDRELSLIASLETLTPESIIGIEGINHGRSDRYAERLLNETQ